MISHAVVHVIISHAVVMISHAVVMISHAVVILWMDSDGLWKRQLTHGGITSTIRQYFMC